MLQVAVGVILVASKDYTAPGSHVLRLRRVHHRRPGVQLPRRDAWDDASCSTGWSVSSSWAWASAPCCRWVDMSDADQPGQGGRRLRVMLLFGGRSAEHDVSRCDRGRGRCRSTRRGTRWYRSPSPPRASGSSPNPPVGTSNGPPRWGRVCCPFASMSTARPPRGGYLVADRWGGRRGGCTRRRRGAAVAARSLRRGRHRAGPARAGRTALRGLGRGRFRCGHGQDHDEARVHRLRHRQRPLGRAPRRPRRRRSRRPGRGGARVPVLREAGEHGLVGGGVEGPRPGRAARRVRGGAALRRVGPGGGERRRARRSRWRCWATTRPWPRCPARSCPATSSTPTPTSTRPTRPSCSCLRRSPPTRSRRRSASWSRRSRRAGARRWHASTCSSRPTGVSCSTRSTRSRASRRSRCTRDCGRRQASRTRSCSTGSWSSPSPATRCREPACRAPALASVESR